MKCPNWGKILAAAALCAALCACSRPQDVLPDHTATPETSATVAPTAAVVQATATHAPTDTTVPTILPQTADAGRSYVDDTLFIGDSNTVRYTMYADDTGTAFSTLKNNIGVVSMGAGSITTLKCEKFKGSSAMYTVPDAVAKLKPAKDQVNAASKNHHITRCNTTIGQPGVLAFRNQPNSPTDDPEEILIQMMEGVSYGCGDACMGINPVENNVESTRRIADAVYSFICRNDIPTQLVVLSHMTTQMDAIRKGAPLSMIFQSIAGTEAANNDFGVSRQLCTEAYELACQHALSTGPNLLYFEPGQGSEVSIGADCGVDEMTLEARTYGFGRFFRPFMVNNVSGFIGPETLYDGKEMIRASLEDHFMGKLTGIPMGCAA